MTINSFLSGGSSSGFVVGLDVLRRGIANNAAALAALNTRGRTRGPRGIYTPFYKYPTSVASDTDVASVVSTARQLRGVASVVVIINPASGPGTATDSNYVELIDAFRGAGCFCAAYVATGMITTPRSEADIKADITTWDELYDGLDGVFLDEMASSLTAGEVETFSNIRKHAKTVLGSGAFVDANPGVGQGLLEHIGTLFDIVVCWENGTFPTETEALGGPEFRKYSRDATACMIHSQASFDIGQWQQMLEWYGYVYATPDEMPNPYDDLHRVYMPELSFEIKSDRSAPFGYYDDLNNSLFVRTSGGDGRGTYAVDLQSFRSVADQVAGQQASVIGGGRANRIGGALGANQVISGGYNNSILESGDSAICGGRDNVLNDATNSTVLGGVGNSIVDSLYGLIFGDNNSITGVGSYNAILGGYDNTISGARNVIINGGADTIDSKAGCTLIRGHFGSATYSCDRSNEIFLASGDGVRYTPFMSSSHGIYGQMLEFILTPGAASGPMDVSETLVVERLANYTGNVLVSVNWGGNEDTTVNAQHNVFAFKLDNGAYLSGNADVINRKTVAGNTTVFFEYLPPTTEFVANISNPDTITAEMSVIATFKVRLS